MSRVEAATMMRALAAEGLTSREIAARTGYAYSTVREYLTDPDGSRTRERKRSYGRACVVCGRRTDGSNGRAAAPRYCREHAASSPEVREARTKWPKSRIIACIRWWADEYGSPPAIIDWNPYFARHKVHDEERARRAERLIANGTIPWFTTVVFHFGSWSAGLEAAGFARRAPHGGGGNQARRRKVAA